MHNSAVLKLANFLINKCGKKINVIIKESKKGPIASYRPDENCIYLRKNACIQEFEKLIKLGFDFSSLYDFFQMLIAHEIGHALDDKLYFLSQKENLLIDQLKFANSEEELDELFFELGKLVIEIETNAWKLSESFLPRNIDLEVLKRYQLHCISSYIYGLENWKSLITEKTSS